MLDTPQPDRIERPIFDYPSEPQRNSRVDAKSTEWIWTVSATILLWRRFIVGVTIAVAVVSVFISLALPNWYAASARVLAPAPNASNSLFSTLTRGFPAASLLGSKSSDYSRYLTILTSRRMYEAVVDSFNLVEVYGTADDPNPRETAMAILAKENLGFSIDTEFEFLSVSVLDQDPARAAQMANFAVRQLNAIDTELASQNATSYRRFIELRYREAEAQSDSLLNAVQAFQQQYGLFDMSVQTQQFFEQVASLRASAIEAEIRFEALQNQLGPDNSDVQALGAAARIFNRKYADALAGQEDLLPIPTTELSGVFRQYLELEREGQIQARILEVVRPLLEQARFDEQRKVEGLQIVDAAVAPVEKSKPRRSVLVITATLSAFLLSIALALGYDAWERNHAYVAHRLRRATAAAVRRTP